MSVSVQYEHLHTVLNNPFFIGFGVGQCEQTIIVLVQFSGVTVACVVPLDRSVSTGRSGAR